MKITYEKNGDYFIPNILPNEEPEEKLTKYGLMRKKFLKEYHGGIYCGMVLRGSLKEHCLMIQDQAEKRLEVMISQMAKAEGITEELKATNQMLWVQKMNLIKLQAEELVVRELVCCL